MTTLDGQALFATGPCRLKTGPRVRELQRRDFAGVGGELLLDYGLRSRQVVLSGRLQAATAEALRAQVEAIEAFADGGAHALVGPGGGTFANVVVESVEVTARTQLGRGYWCEYEVAFRQLP